MALETLAVRRGRDLDAEGVRILPMGGATNIGHFLARYGPGGRNVRLAGLCDAAEEPAFRRGCVYAAASGRLALEPTWNDSASSSASPTWRTS